MCLFGARGIEENRIVFFINNIFVDENLKAYKRTENSLKFSEIGLVNNITGRRGEVGADDLSDEEIIGFLKGDLRVRDLAKKEEKEDKI